MRRIIPATVSLAIIAATTLLYPHWLNAQAPATITQKGIAFAPSSATIRVGEQIVFRNLDPFGHNVYSPSEGGAFDIGLQPPASETAVTFRDPGKYTIMCRIHPKMRATVTVKP